MNGSIDRPIFNYFANLGEKFVAFKEKISPPPMVGLGEIWVGLFALMIKEIPTSAKIVAFIGLLHGLTVFSPEKPGDHNPSADL